MTAPKPMPARVEKHLVATGVLTTDRLGRAAQLRHCTRCRALVIVGLDAPMCALRVECDPVAIDQLGEAWAWLNGRRTFALWGTELHARDKWSITGGMNKPVTSEHECGTKKAPSTEILTLFVKPVAIAGKGKAPF